jgi:hypothetical protein
VVLAGWQWRDYRELGAHSELGWDRLDRAASVLHGLGPDGPAAAYVAEEGRATRAQPSANPVTEAADQLRGIALGFAELRQASRQTA